MTNRLLAAVALVGAVTAGCGLVGNEGERQAAVVHWIRLDCHNATDQVADLNQEKRSFEHRLERAED